MSAIDSIIDYKPRNTINQVYSDVRLRNHIWAIKVMELNKAPITLSGLKLYKVKDTNELTNAMMETWVKDFKHVLHYLSGTRIGQSVQIGLNIGYGVVDLIKTPVEEYNKGGNFRCIPQALMYIRKRAERNWNGSHILGQDGHSGTAQHWCILSDHYEEDVGQP